MASKMTLADVYHLSCSYPIQFCQFKIIRIVVRENEVISSLMLKNVSSDPFPWSCRYWMLFQGFLLLANLILTANGALINHVCNSSSHSWPKHNLSSAFYCISYSNVSYVQFLQNRFPDFFWNQYLLSFEY